MIIDVIQTSSPAYYSSNPMVLEFKNKEIPIGSLYAEKAPVVLGGLDYHAEWSGEHSYIIKLQKNIIPECPIGFTKGINGWKTKLADGSIYGYSKDGYVILKSDYTKEGHYLFHQVIYPKKNFFKPRRCVNYDQLVMQDNIYDAYEVRTNGKGVWLCIFKDNVLVAEIEKIYPVVNYLNNYKIYLMDENNSEHICLIACQWHLGFDSNHKEERNSVEYDTGYGEYRKEVLEKFSEDFVEQVKRNSL